jgi:hypothetical protein
VNEPDQKCVSPNTVPLPLAEVGLPFGMAAQHSLQATPLRGLVSGHDLVRCRVFPSEARRVSRGAPELIRYFHLRFAY